MVTDHVDMRVWILRQTDRIWVWRVTRNALEEAGKGIRSEKGMARLCGHIGTRLLHRPEMASRTKAFTAIKSM